MGGVGQVAPLGRGQQGRAGADADDPGQPASRRSGRLQARGGRPQHRVPAQPALRRQKAIVDFAPPEGDYAAHGRDCLPLPQAAGPGCGPGAADGDFAGAQRNGGDRGPAGRGDHRPLIDGCRYAIVSESPKEWEFDLIGEGGEQVSARLVRRRRPPGGTPFDDHARRAVDAGGGRHFRGERLARQHGPDRSAGGLERRPVLPGVRERRQRVAAQPHHGQRQTGEGGRFDRRAVEDLQRAACGAAEHRGLAGAGGRSAEVALRGPVVRDELLCVGPPAAGVASNEVESGGLSGPGESGAAHSLCGAGHGAVRYPDAPRSRDGAAGRRGDHRGRGPEADQGRAAAPGGVRRNPEARYANKPVTLNGAVIGILPPNARYDIDRWAERVMEIPADKLPALAADNEIVVANCGGDCFKFGDAALAVQLPGGFWVDSRRDGSVYCGCGVGGGWLYHEGKGFSTKSPPIRLTLPVVP